MDESAVPASPPQRGRGRRRPAALTGLAFAAAALAVLHVPELLLPSTGAYGGSVFGSGTVPLLHAAGAVLAGLLLVLFAVSLAGLVGRRDRRAGSAAAAVLTGALLYAAVGCLFALERTGAAYGVVPSPTVQIALLFGARPLLLAFVIGTASRAADRIGVLPKWLTTAGEFAAAVTVLAMIARVAGLIPAPVAHYPGLAVAAAMSVVPAAGYAGRGASRARDA